MVSRAANPFPTTLSFRASPDVLFKGTTRNLLLAFVARYFFAADKF
jgi:hypothetical protein